MFKNPKTIIFSRTDSIGDVMLTLPMIGIFKEFFPSCKIIFLGKKYTKAIADSCKNIDVFLDWDELVSQPPKDRPAILKSLTADAIIHIFPNRKISTLAKKAKIPLRIGTSHRIYHWLTCNKLVNFTRKNSNLHEAQLNLKLLEHFGIKKDYSLKELENYYGLKAIEKTEGLKNLIDDGRFNLILHPKSKGSAREWGLANFSDLIKHLPDDKFKIFITGTKEEGEMMENFFSENPHTIDLTGKFSLGELIAFINSADGIVAASTGPLHIAAALGKTAIGIYAPMRPIHPGRWAPVGKNANVFVLDKICKDCRKKKDCVCIRSVSPLEVAKKLLKFSK